MATKNMEIYLTGNTVTLEAQFTDYEGNPIEVQMPKVIIYDYKYNIIKEVTLMDSNKVVGQVGKYFYNYITEMKPMKLIYEIRGEVNGFPILDRKEFMTKFVD
jgi:hypothetical protein